MMIRLNSFSKILLFASAATLITGSCTVSGPVSHNPKFALQAGINHGGIVENTDLSVVPGVDPTPESTVDAYSGATRIGGNAGIHVNLPLRRNEIETGIDYMYIAQEFRYADQGNHYLGVRDLHVSQLMLPVTYNIVLFPKTLPASELQLKLGYVAQFNFVSGTGTGLLPDYSVKAFSQGATFGVSAYLLTLKNDDKLGLFFDLYRGSRIYSDYYNQDSFEMPGSSYLKFGVRYRFN